MKNGGSFHSFLYVYLWHTIFVGMNIHKSSTNSIFLSQLFVDVNRIKAPQKKKNRHVESLKLNGVNNPLALIFDTFQSKPWFLVWSGLVLDPFMLGPFSRVIMICMYIYIYIYIYNIYIYIHIYIYIYTYCHPPTRTYLQHHLVVIQ